MKITGECIDESSLLASSSILVCHRPVGRVEMLSFLLWCNLGEQRVSQWSRRLSGWVGLRLGVRHVGFRKRVLFGESAGVG